VDALAVFGLVYPIERDERTDFESYQGASIGAGENILKNKFKIPLPGLRIAPWPDIKSRWIWLGADLDRPDLESLGSGRHQIYGSPAN
jgi:hypothetical protein